MTDNARELSMREGHDICKHDGIKLHTTVTYNPASNSRADRTNGALTNAMRAMLHESGLPKFLWVQAFSRVTYVHNRTPTKALDGRTPNEMLYDMEPNLADLLCHASNRARY